MIVRNLSKRIAEAATRYPAITLTGPRQSGKTTLARASFPQLSYVSLEDPDAQRSALADPRGFLGRVTNGAILDEVQRAPELLSYLQAIIDSDPNRCGAWVLTGSQNFGLMSNATQSLAGRTAVFELLPFDLAEWKRVPANGGELAEMLFAGFYPRIHDAGLPPTRWLADYVATYVERDARQILNIGDLAAFQTFLRLCAGRSGQLLNVSSLAVDAGISHATARNWLSVLEASYLLFRLAPWHRNLNKRLVKTPKLYFTDSGLLCYLLGIREPGQVLDHPLRGPIFETFVVAELRKQQVHRGERPEMYFWRDAGGLEVDVILDHGLDVDAIECKSGRTVGEDFWKSLDAFAALIAPFRREVRTLTRRVVYGGDASLTQQKTEIVAWKDLDRLAPESD